MDGRLALTLVTGFLGSGKTTLIRRFVETDEGADTGIIVNEFGEEGVDHQLFVHAVEQVELIDGGCLCCARRNDIAQAMYRLVQLSKSGKAFGRAILETSGLADPAPIVATLDRDPWLRAHVRLASIVAVVDAVSILRTLDTEGEAVRQVSIADTIVIAKSDMRNACETAAIEERLRLISPVLRILDAQDPNFDPAGVLGGRGNPALVQPQRPDLTPSHAGDVSSFTLKIADRLDWPAFTLWLSALLHAYGDRILRVKGLLRTSSSETPLAIHGVQHIMHPPTHLPGEYLDRESFLVFITKGMEREAIVQSLGTFMQCRIIA